MKFRLLAAAGLSAALAVLTITTVRKVGASPPATGTEAYRPAHVSAENQAQAPARANEATTPPPAVEPGTGADTAPESSTRLDASVSFVSGVRPILEAHCRPCHYEGGTMYARMPFDQPRTIRRLGERLFTRIQKEDERAVIRAFLAQPAGPSEGP